jgi:hypothetical protein
MISLNILLEGNIVINKMMKKINTDHNFKKEDSTKNLRVSSRVKIIKEIMKRIFNTIITEEMIKIIIKIMGFNKMIEIMEPTFEETIKTIEASIK